MKNVLKPFSTVNEAVEPLSANDNRLSLLLNPFLPYQARQSSAAFFNDFLFVVWGGLDLVRGLGYFCTVLFRYLSLSVSNGQIAALKSVGFDVLHICALLIRGTIQIMLSPLPILFALVTRPLSTAWYAAHEETHLQEKMSPVPNHVDSEEFLTRSELTDMKRNSCDEIEAETGQNVRMALMNNYNTVFGADIHDDYMESTDEDPTYSEDESETGTLNNDESTRQEELMTIGSEEALSESEEGCFHSGEEADNSVYPLINELTRQRSSAMRIENSVYMGDDLSCSNGKQVTRHN